MAEDPKINQVLVDRFKPLEQIGKGSFGTVYTGIDLTNQEKIAIKFESRDEKSQGLLEGESNKLRSVRGEGIPKILCFGKIKGFNFLVMELLGRSLNDLFLSQGKKFSLKTVCILGIEMIKRIGYIHERLLLHRDIKPDNFMMGTGAKEDTLFLIDFGLSRKYRNGKDKQHIPFKTGKSITGTARYCSVYTHIGYEQSRRDDLESIGYVLLYFLRGNLPWQGAKVKEGEKHYDKIGQIKKATSTVELCEDNPEELQYYFNYVKQLEFEEEPNYNFLIELFEKILQKYCDISTCYTSLDWKCKTHKKDQRVISKKTIRSNSKNKSIIVYNNNNNGQVSSSSNFQEQKELMNKLETYISFDTNSKKKMVFDNKLTKIRKPSESSIGNTNYINNYYILANNGNAMNNCNGNGTNGNGVNGNIRESKNHLKTEESRVMTTEQANNLKKNAITKVPSGLKQPITTQPNNNPTEGQTVKPPPRQKKKAKGEVHCQCVFF